jgi:hypothetical protein
MPEANSLPFRKWAGITETGSKVWKFYKFMQFLY